MLKKRYLSIVKVLLLVIGILGLFGIEWYRAYAVCSDEVLAYYARSTSGEYQIEYQYTRFSPLEPVQMFFDDGEGGAWCYVRRHGFNWEVNAIGLVAIYP